MDNVKRFRQFITEKLLAPEHGEIQVFGAPYTTKDIYVNPSPSEFNASIRGKTYDTRGFIADDGTLYIWHADMPHIAAGVVLKEFLPELKNKSVHQIDELIAEPEKHKIGMMVSIFKQTNVYPAESIYNLKRPAVETYIKTLFDRCGKKMRNLTFHYAPYYSQ